MPPWITEEDDEDVEHGYITPQLSFTPPSPRGSDDDSEQDDPSPSPEFPVEISDFSPEDDSLVELIDTALDLQSKPQKKILHHLRQSEFIYPLSGYQGNTPPLSLSKEWQVVKDFQELVKQENPSGLNASYGDDKFLEIELSQFFIYLPGTNGHHAYEMTGLQDLITRPGNPLYCFDGILSVGGQKRYVQGVPFKLVSVAGYGIEFDEVEHVWIKSCANSRSNVYYRLKEPHPHYKRYHDGYLWLANLSKHFVDYALEVAEAGRKVSIHNFRRDFADRMGKEHRESASFQEWLKKYNGRDFRSALTSNIDFIAKDAIGTYMLDDLDIWAEVKYKTAIPFHEPKETMTAVTPYVYDCFEHMKFGSHLKKVHPSIQSQIRRESQGNALHLTLDAEFTEENPDLQTQTSITPAAKSRKVKGSLQQFCSRPFDVKSISVGDVLGVKTDGVGSSWKDEETHWKEPDECWYVYVQGVHTTQSGNRSFHVLWLYRPADTACALMKYPHGDELFLSDNCSCSTSRISEDEVLCKVSVAWDGNPGQTEADFFIRQTYESDNSFVTFKEEHKLCDHLVVNVTTPIQKLAEQYKIGDTVLVNPKGCFKSNFGLEPCEIIGFVQGIISFVRVRRLLRRREIGDDTPARPNELVYSDDMASIDADEVYRRCFVRFYSQSQIINKEVPAPYCRDGTGDMFYIASRLVRLDDKNHLKEIDSTSRPQSLIQGFDPTQPPPFRRLRGLDMFCGGGNFGRGLEEAGAIKFTHAVDMAPNAIATYYANTEDPTTTQFFCGSVDDMLIKALSGNVEGALEIPLPGDIDFIAAGSPCVGYSILNPNKDSAQGLKNQSLIADVASMIDFYRPKYALLENVLTMAQKGKGRNHDSLSQLICCIVGMGYQLQVYVLDAWSFGSPQGRSRLFVSVAAPGFKLPPRPDCSHSHPNGTSDRGLGTMANGKAFGERLFVETPFKFVSAAEATEHLPDIGDGHPGHCSQYPDHRPSRSPRDTLRQHMNIIPFSPPGMNFIKTWKNRHITGMTKHDYENFNTVTKKGKQRHNAMEFSRAYGRIVPTSLFSTIVTNCSPENARSGRVLHWSQPRLLTIEEAKIAQGFVQGDALTGTRGEQYKIAGNSVARTVALAQGLSYREVWLKNGPEEDDTGEVPVAEQIQKQLFADMITSDDRGEFTAIPDSNSSSGDVSEDRYCRALDKLKLSSPAKTDDDISSLSSSTSGAPQTTRKRHKTQNDIPISPTNPPPSLPKSRFPPTVAARLGVDVAAVRAEHAMEQAAKRKAERVASASRFSIRNAIEDAFGAEGDSSQEGKVSKAKRTPLPVRAPARATVVGESSPLSARRRKKIAWLKDRMGSTVEGRKRPDEAFNLWPTPQVTKRGNIRGQIQSTAGSTLQPAKAQGGASDEQMSKKRKTTASDTASPSMPQTGIQTAKTPASTSEEQSPKRRRTAASSTSNTATAGASHSQTHTARRRPPKSKTQFVIDLTGDSDVERRGDRRVYVPVDNSMFGAYEMTYNSSMVGMRDPAVVVDGVNGPFAY
ncbi:DNA methyltransferase Dim-2 [Pseudogymnoascus destructans]|uniref:DNA (cytosine-5-)-methyltransferase n=2 Tax=Pseudogymnoascus destructans TaxID=655981 RepID=L8FYW5_PSED2|nr:DNA methyltransferase Dim-2 [Pseudogymnoascus destructans]ELR06200.1 hypothetical protein GMDG_07855 [Pseudogymnoascus destructans 20631-21]OAF56665.2 DNA methyltransferase Dim-2 [Pseudogymnoascus destructans]